MGQQKVRVITFLGVSNASESESNYLVGGVEKSLIEQVREIVDPGLTNTELFPWITAAAAAEKNYKMIFLKS